ncbi:MAG: hypothetical protein OEZ14_16410, partial [Acidimicrobiia bacterium]|nr:hypothetical protein [Acidimicrobiia bacterium]
VLGVIWVGWHVPFYLYRDGMVDASVGEHRGVRHGSRDRGDRLLVASHVDNRDGCGDGMTTTIGEGVTLLPALVARRAYRWQYPGGIPRSWARP